MSKGSKKNEAVHSSVSVDGREGLIEGLYEQGLIFWRLSQLMLYFSVDVIKHYEQDNI